MISSCKENVMEGDKRKPWADVCDSDDDISHVSATHSCDKPQRKTTIPVAQGV